jgi:diaminohydroxyphosphoribosylaminopyrimidine deaminase/5-amino-6-(5-phosphoribosylamino)uracil reductase
VRAGKVLGQGCHRGVGTAHAETVALDGIDARGATVYVNLEPCNHHAHTPPCSEALIAAGIERVVTAMVDPDVRVGGSGIERLRSSGIRVDVGVCEPQARALNLPYIHHRTTGRSFIALKLAQTIDGRLAAADGSARWITGSEARRTVHESRARADAVLVGATTAVVDDPSLTARTVDVDPGTQPLRVIVDSTGRTSPEARAFGPEGPALIATTDRCSHDRQLAYKEAGVEVLILGERDGRVDLAALVEALGRRDIVEIYCEGGAELASSLLRDDLVGRLEIHTGSLLAGAGPQVAGLGVGSLTDARRWHLESARSADDDVISIYTREA